jgi:hypothetical protein
MKSLRRTDDGRKAMAGLVRNIIPSATSLRGVYEFQHTSYLTNLSLTLFLAHLAVARVRESIGNVFVSDSPLKLLNGIS